MIHWNHERVNRFATSGDGGDKEFIEITEYDAIWINSQEKYRLLFNKKRSSKDNHLSSAKF